MAALVDGVAGLPGAEAAVANSSRVVCGRGLRIEGAAPWATAPAKKLSMVPGRSIVIDTVTCIGKIRIVSVLKLNGKCKLLRECKMS